MILKCIRIYKGLEVKSLSPALAASLIVAYQASPSIGEYPVSLPFPAQEALPDAQGSDRFPTLQADTLLSEPLGLP